MKPLTGGVLDPRAGESHYQEGLHPPPADLADLIWRYWGATWDLRGGEPYIQHLLPHPNSNLVIEPGRARIVAISTARVTYTFNGQGWIFGVSFRPASFRALLGAPLASIVNRELRVPDVFGLGGRLLVRRLLSAETMAGRVEHANAFFRQRRPPPDTTARQLNELVEAIMTDRSIVRVEDAAIRMGVSRRTLQRLFSEYIGVSPKWVIQRYRLQDAADRLAGPERVDLADLAHDLGYFDQSHFTRDFTRIIGRAPGEYARQQQ